MIQKCKQLTGIALCVLLAAQTGSAQTAAVKKLTLEEAIQLSLSNSKKLKLSNAKVDEAIANYRGSKDGRLPDLKVSGSYLRVNNPDYDVKLKTGSSSNSGSGSGSGSGSSESSSSAGSIKVNEVGYAMANASLPLFSGFRIKYGIESARYLEQAAKLDAEYDREGVILNTVNAFSNLYKAAKSVELVKENLGREQQRVKDYTNLEQNGLIARNDLLKMQLQQSNVELALLDAENNYRITCINMALMLGLPEDTELMADSAFITAPVAAGTAIQWEQAAMSGRKDKEALAIRQKAAEIGIKAAKSEYYPGVALSGGYVYANIPKLIVIKDALNGGIGLQYNIASLWKAGSKVDAAKARLHQTEANQNMLDDQIKLDINNAYQSYLLSTRKIDVYNKAIAQANENYRITKNKYDNSLVTTTDLLDADVAQLQAELNYTFSKADAIVAYKKLQQTAGILTEK